MFYHWATAAGVPSFFMNNHAFTQFVLKNMKKCTIKLFIERLKLEGLYNRSNEIVTKAAFSTKKFISVTKNYNLYKDNVAMECIIFAQIWCYY